MLTIHCIYSYLSIEVQIAKGEVMQEVVRTSPEEKLRDYYLQLNRMISVMNRQQLLAAALTPVAHAFLGSKSVCMFILLYEYTLICTNSYTSRWQKRVTNCSSSLHSLHTPVTIHHDTINQCMVCIQQLHSRPVPPWQPRCERVF